jgi:hypothetical protein
MLCHSSPFRWGKTDKSPQGIRPGASRGVIEIREEQRRRVSCRRSVRRTVRQAELAGVPQRRTESSTRIYRKITPVA